MTLKDELIKEVIAIEGGYINYPTDSGGETNYGITATTAKEYGYTRLMGAMPKSIAIDIYEDMYWHAISGDKVAALTEMVVEELFDTAVNVGASRAITFLQRALTSLNCGGKLYDDIKVDGAIGPKTINALRCYMDCRDETVLVTVLNSLQGAFYVELAERREKDEKYLYGWIKNRVET